MKAVIIIISAVVLVAAVAAGVWYYKTRFYVSDKDGMVYLLTDTITSCYYESGGSMNGELTEAEIYLKDDGEVWLNYHYHYPVGTDKENINLEYRIDAKAIEDIREVCKKYGVLGWGKLKRSDVLVLDGATDLIALKFADKEYYSVNSGLELPEGGEKIFDEIFEIMKLYIQGDD
ncbi:MAG: hypothetical protein IKK49_06150 [Clostridia bacterium]|nr:hypothetical protein [Clostridia bacterium]